MTVRELREMLEFMNDDAEVLVAHQPNYPLQEMCVNVVEMKAEPYTLNPVDTDGAYDDEPRSEDDMSEDDLVDVVYLVAGQGRYDLHPYAPRSVFGR